MKLTKGNITALSSLFGLSLAVFGATLTTLGMGVALIISILFFGVGVFTIWVIAWLNTKKLDIKVDFTNERNRAYKYIEGSEKYVYTTHFAKSIPPVAYTNKMLEKMGEGLQVHRIVDSKLLSDPEIKEWLSRFEGHPNYKQYDASLSWLFDFTIFDGEEAILYFPSQVVLEDFDFAMYIEKKILVDVFSSIFIKILPKKTEEMPFYTTASNFVWLRDAFHVPYLVIEGSLSNTGGENISNLLVKKYRKVDLNNIGECYAIENSNRVLFSVAGDRCAVCYFISGEAKNDANYIDVITSLRSDLDKYVSEIQEFMSENGVSIQLSKIYQQDPSRYQA